MRIAIIPARGGSRRIPRKNIAYFPSNPPGKPMIMYPILAAQESGLFDLIVVSTDDTEIGSLAFDVNVIPVPRAYDDGTIGTQEVAARVLDELDARGEACVIYPCSPLLEPADLRAGLEMMGSPFSPSFVVSVDPYMNDAGCFYWGQTSAFRQRKPLDPRCGTARYVLPAERCIDINTPDDWRRAESMFTALRRAK